MFNLFNRNRQSRVDRLEEGFIQLEEQSARTTDLLERVIVIQERQQTSIEQSFRRIEQSNERINQLYEEIRGLRTESLRIQRHIFGDEVDGN